MDRPVPKVLDLIVTARSLLVVVLALLFTLSACAQPPEARFTVSPSKGHAPLEVQFTNLSQNADEFQWDFGDGAIKTTTSVEESVTYEYTKAGTHTATLTAIKEGESPQTSTVTMAITVEPGPLDHVTLEPAATTVEVSQVQQFTATALDQFENPIPGLTYIFGSHEQVGEMDSKGRLIAATKPGLYQNGVAVEVTQRSVTETATADITLEPGPLDQVNIEPASVTLEVNREQQFIAKALDEFGNPIPGLTLSFTADEQVGKVDSEGNYIAGTVAGLYQEGVTVMVSQGSVTRTKAATITIEPGPLDRVTLEPGSATTEVAQELQFTVTPLDQFGNEIQELTFEWSASAGGIIEPTGTFTAGIAAGAFPDAVRVGVTQGAIRASATATVNLSPGALDHIVIDPHSVKVDIGEPQSFAAKAFDQFDNEIQGLTFEWQVIGGVGTMGPSGRFTAGTRAGTFP